MDVASVITSPSQHLEFQYVNPSICDLAKKVNELRAKLIQRQDDKQKDLDKLNHYYKILACTTWQCTGSFVCLSELAATAYGAIITGSNALGVGGLIGCVCLAMVFTVGQDYHKERIDNLEYEILELGNQVSYANAMQHLLECYDSKPEDRLAMIPEIRNWYYCQEPDSLAVEDIFSVLQTFLTDDCKVKNTVKEIIKNSKNEQLWKTLSELTKCHLNYLKIDHHLYFRPGAKVCLLEKGGNVYKNSVFV